MTHPAADRGPAAITLAAGPAVLLLIVILTGAVAGITGQQAAACQAQPAASTAAASIPVGYLADYQKAGARYGIPWTLLAGIGTVESGNGQSTAPGVHSGTNAYGAAGPMQFGTGGAAGNTWGGAPSTRAARGRLGHARPAGEVPAGRPGRHRHADADGHAAVLRGSGEDGQHREPGHHQHQGTRGRSGGPARVRQNTDSRTRPHRHGARWRPRLRSRHARDLRAEPGAGGGRIAAGQRWLGGGDGQQGLGAHGHDGVAVEGVPQPDLVLGQAGLPVSVGEAFFSHLFPATLIRTGSDTGRPSGAWQ